MKPEVLEYWLEVIGLLILIINLPFNSMVWEGFGLIVLTVSVLLDKPE